MSPSRTINICTQPVEPQPTCFRVEDYQALNNWGGREAFDTWLEDEGIKPMRCYRIDFNGEGPAILNCFTDPMRIVGNEVEKVAIPRAFSKPPPIRWVADHWEGKAEGP